MLAPTLRIRLKMLVALPMRSRGTGIIGDGCQRHKNQPRPAPCNISGHQKFQKPTSQAEE